LIHLTSFWWPWRCVIHSALPSLGETMKVVRYVSYSYFIANKSFGASDKMITSFFHFDAEKSFVHGFNFSCTYYTLVLNELSGTLFHVADYASLWILWWMLKKVSSWFTDLFKCLVLISYLYSVGYLPINGKYDMLNWMFTISITLSIDK